MHTRISSGSPWESSVGYSRAVIAGDTIYISGTAGEGPDVYRQTLSALASVTTVLAESGFELSEVVQSRLVVADFENWEDAARAHGEVYGEVKPAFSLVHALPFVDAEILVEVECIAVRHRAV
ncbi:Rid family hydrolase [Rhodococcus sp. 14-2483-1-2]|uniref:Rid family hydrolase n=1 Tax=Rhodococcus sp. 14-2483-1-2 TaxID=2023147 RepID=UPI000B9A632F|nr:Rid family hydrolase [Rhodococcus sp. 14-2483-1-2]OZF26328.1 hypothetical protein CH295_27120 [Rhodococcus sp. 14-2483-1-2]